MKRALAPIVLAAWMQAVPLAPALGAGAAEPPGVGKSLTVVVFGGHPDDPESGAGGLVAALAKQGHKVICAYGTAFRGDRRVLGRPEAEVRRAEATAACKVLGATPRFFPYAHEKLNADEPTLKAVAAWLDEVKPDVVVTHWPLDTHPNHHVVGSLVWQCYKRSGGWNLYFFEVMTDQQTIAFAPELYLDLTPVLDIKQRALNEHVSQDPESIWKVHDRMHLRRGAECGVERAEAYALVEAKAGCPLLPVPFLSRRGSTAKGTAAPSATISQARRDENGVLTHTVRSPYQAAETTVRVLVPDGLKPAERVPVVYVLPVEAGDGHRYGDGLLEVRKLGLHNRLRAIFAAPTFADLPWYADNPSDPRVRQESDLLEVVLPLVEATYPAQRGAEGRLLLGFSKSGWGAFSLLLRHPDVFARAAAWDAPLMMDQPGRYGSGPIFGTPVNFAEYQVTRLLDRRAGDLRGEPRLALLGYGNFRREHAKFHDLLVRLHVPHAYADGPHREHVWGSGWVPEAATWLVRRQGLGPGLELEPGTAAGSRSR
jgi:LmbE family N-acetylglucosaminyl deacetylase